MSIIILGAGAIGSLYGAKLSKLNDVLLIGRESHVNAINKNGLATRGMENQNYKLKASAKIDKIDDSSLILLTTKVHGSRNAINSIEDLIRKDTIIMCIQNGLGSENIVKEIIKGKCLVLRGVTNFGAAFLEDGVIEYNTYGYTAIENSPASSIIAENFTKCGLNAHTSKNIKEDIWKKLILNCVLNPITAILGIRNGEIADERLNPLKKLVIDECLKVAEKDGVKFDFDFLKSLNEGIKNSKNISSMRQDLLKGRKTEIDYLNLAVAELGRRHGIKCPVNESLAAIIREMESKKIQLKIKFTRNLKITP